MPHSTTSSDLRLTPQKKRALQNLIEASGKTTDDCIHLLEKYNWDYEVTMRALNPSSASTSISNSNENIKFDFFGLFLWPFRFTWKILSWSIAYIFPSNNTRLLQQRPVERFIHYFETTYGELPIRPLDCSYKQALDRAKQELKFLLIYLHCEEHQDTKAFCQQVLSSAAIATFLSEHQWLVWVGNVQEAEGYQVAHALGTAKYPFFAVVALQSTSGSSGSRMQVVSRIEGLLTVDDILAQFMNTTETYGRFLEAERAERNERNLSRELRQEQDSAYLRSLKADEEKERKAQEEQEQQQKKKMKLEKLKENLKIRQLLLESVVEKLQFKFSCSAPEGDTIARLSFKLPNGERVIRSFSSTDRIEEVYKFVLSQDISPIDVAGSGIEPSEEDISHFPEPGTEDFDKVPMTFFDHHPNNPFGFILLSPFPRKVYRDLSKTVEECGWCPGINLMVEEDDEESIHHFSELLS